METNWKMDKLEAAAGRFSEALSQMQKSLEAAAERAGAAVRKSDEELHAANEEIAHLKKLLAELEGKHEKLRAVAEKVSIRINDATMKVRSLVEG
tara:strand:- start:238 stop:522 length:285 start_codon:yes stop_codon:yes gene_type:complete